MDCVIELVVDYGIGLVVLCNVNYWMCGGSYGWQVVEKGYIGICWINFIVVMSLWGVKECCIGINLLIVVIFFMLIIMVDMLMLMFFYGMLEVNCLVGCQFLVDGGFDDEGNLIKEFGVIEKNCCILLMGYWKGFGMLIVLDMIVIFFFDGVFVVEVIQDNSDEYGIL